jgi:hypothetical protein
MGVFQVLFLLINVSLPVYFITRTSDTAPQTNWGAWEKSMARLIDSDGGFPGCSTLSLVNTLEDMCEESRRQMTEKKTIVVEQAGDGVVFRCEYTSTSIRVGWRLKESKDTDVKCRSPGGSIAPLSPGFTFAHDGRMRSLEFNGPNGKRQIMPMRNCRIKIVRAKKLTPPPTRAEFLVRLGQAPRDPPDHLNANFMCFVFDLSPRWLEWRDRYPR